MPNDNQKVSASSQAPLPPRQYGNDIASGIDCLIEGFRLIWHKDLRLYILVPLVVNCFLFFTLTALFLSKFSSTVEFVQTALPGWLAPLAWIAIAIVAVIGLIMYGYSFNMITNIIASPFYGVLAEKAENLITGQNIEPESLITMVPRVIMRELIKLWYFLTRGFVVLLVMILVGTIPLVNILAPVIGLAWGAWSMSIQYSDYAADNNQLGFKELRQCLWAQKYSSMGFGGVVMFMSIIPVINIFAMPAAVTGGTVYWARGLKRCSSGACPIP